MTHRILLARPAEKDLDRLDPSLREIIIAEIRALAANPRPPGCRKLAGAAYNWRIRVRDYRVLYSVEDRGRTVRVYRVRHRSRAYR